jgi:hypothetical protein
MIGVGSKLDFIVIVIDGGIALLTLDNIPRSGTIGTDSTVVQFVHRSTDRTLNVKHQPLPCGKAAAKVQNRRKRGPVVQTRDKNLSRNDTRNG